MGVILHRIGRAVSASFAPGGRAIARVAAAILVVALVWSSAARAQPVQTIRYDLTGLPLAIFGLEFVQDFFFTPEPAEIVKTRFHLTFNTETSFGSFPAQDVGLVLQPPISDPTGPGGILTGIFTGADFGWSGSGTFNYMQETDALNGVALPAPPGSPALLYGVTYFNAKRLTDPGDFTPMGGQYLDSYIEIDFVVIPEPGSFGGAASLVGMTILSRRRRRQKPSGVSRI